MAAPIQDLPQVFREVEERLAGTRHIDYFREMRGRYLHLLRHALSGGGDPRALEVGCSPGTFTLLMSRAGLQVAGLDLDPFESFHAGGGEGALASLAGLANVQLFKLDILQGRFPFRDGSFDLVFFNETIEHLHMRPQVPLGEMGRVMKPGGRLYITTPNVVSLRNRLRFLGGKNIYASVGEMCELSPYKRHHREYTMSDLCELVQRVGLFPAERQFHNFGGPPGESRAKKLSRIAYNLLCKAAPPLSTHLLLVAEKRSV